MIQLKKLLKNSRFITIALMTILATVIAISSATYAWYLVNKTIDGNTIQTGAFSSDIYVFDENEDLMMDGVRPLDLNSNPIFTERDFSDNIENESCTGDSSTWGPGCINGVPSYGNINGNTITRYVKFINTSPINTEYAIDFHIVGDAGIAGAFEYRITPANAVHVESMSEFQSFAINSTTSFGTTGSFTSLLTINTDDYYGILNKASHPAYETMYYKIEFRCVNSSTYYSGQQIELSLVLHTGQIGSFENADGNIYLVGSVSQMRNALANSLPGDTIRLSSSFVYPYDIVLNKRVHLDMNGYNLTVNNLIVEFSSSGIWRLKTASIGYLNVINDMYINTPNANIEFVGSYEYSNDAVVGGKVTLGASYGEGVEFLQQFKMVDSDNERHDIILKKNTYLYIDTATTVGNISVEEDATWIKITNYGAIKTINLEDITFIASSTVSYQIYIESFGDITDTVGETDANILLPDDSNTYNTYIYQSALASYITVYSAGGQYTTSNVIRDTQTGYVIHIENIDPTVHEYRVTLNDNVHPLQGNTNPLLGVLYQGYIDESMNSSEQDGYFETLEEMQSITKLTIVTTRTQELDLSVFTAAGQGNSVYFPNLKSLDLSLAYVPNNTIINTAFRNAVLDELYLPRTTISLAGTAYNTGCFSGSNIGYLDIPTNVTSFYPGWNYFANTVYMESDNVDTYLNNVYASTSYAVNLDRKTILVPDGVIDYLEETSEVSYDDSLVYYLGFKRRGTLDSTGIYWIKRNALGNGYVITAIDSRYNVSRLTSLELPTELSMDGNAFLPVTGIESYALTRLCDFTGTLTIPSSITSIGMYALFNVNASSINTGGITSLNMRGTFARNSNSNGMTITMPNVLSITGPSSFNKYRSTAFSAPLLRTINSSTAYNLEEYVFDDNEFTSFNVPAIQNIRNNAIYKLNGLTTLNISNATYLGNNALVLSNSVTSINAANVVTMENHAIYNYSALQNITLANLEEATDYAIDTCNNVTSLNMPNLILASEHAFNEMNAVTSITANGLAEANNSAFTGFDSLTSVSMTGLASVSNYLFYDIPLLTSLSLPNLQYLDKLYAGASRLTTLTISSPSNVTTGSPVVTCEVTARSFQDMSVLQTLTSTNITKIGTYAFAGAEDLVTVNLPNLTQTVGQSHFADCPSLTTVTMNSLLVVGTSMFENDSLLAKVYLPLATTISSRGFYRCSVLSRIYNSGYSTSANGLYAPAIITIGDEAFYRCSGLASAAIGNTVTIGERAFYQCSLMSSVTLTSVTTISKEAFYSCVGLTGTLTLTSNDITFGDNAFSYTGYSAIDVRISAAEPSIGEESPFAFMSSLEAVTLEDCAYKNATVNGGLFYNSSANISEFYFKFSLVPHATNIDGFTNLVQTGCSQTFVYVLSSLYDNYILDGNDWNLEPDTVENAVTVHFIPDNAVTVYYSSGGGYWSGGTRYAYYIGRTFASGSNTYIEVFAYIYNLLTASFTVNGSTRSFYTQSSGGTAYYIDRVGYAAFSNFYWSATTATASNIAITLNSMSSVGDRAFFNTRGIGSVAITGNYYATASHQYVGTQTSGQYLGDSSYIVGTLGKYVFTCSSIHTINDGDNVLALGDYMFAYCYNLATLERASSYNYIGYRTFYYCISLTILAIPSVVAILGYAFENSGVTTLTFGDDWTYADNDCLNGNENLSSVTITTVNQAFNQDVEEFNLPDNIGLDVFYPYANEAYLFTFPGIYQLLQAYGNSAGQSSDTYPDFYYTAYNGSTTEIQITGYVGSLTNLTIPNTIDGKNVVSIAANVTGFSNVIYLTLPRYYQYYQIGCFDNMSALTTFYVDSNNTNFSANNGILYSYNDSRRTLYKYPIDKSGTSFTLTTNNATNTIAPHAFYGVRNLTSIQTRYIVSIGDQAFANSSIVTYRFDNRANSTSDPVPALGSENIFTLRNNTVIRLYSSSVYTNYYSHNAMWMRYVDYFTW